MNSIMQYDLRGCNVGITDGSDLCGTLPGWHEIPTKIYDNRFKNLNNIRVII
jgi:hypothetical protein